MACITAEDSCVPSGRSNIFTPHVNGLPNMNVLFHRTTRSKQIEGGATTSVSWDGERASRYCLLRRGHLLPKATVGQQKSQQRGQYQSHAHVRISPGCIGSQR